MDHKLDLAGAAEDPLDRLRVADVGVLDPELRVLGDEPLGHMRGRGLGAEELRPHVVLDADDVEALTDEMADGLGADQPPRSRHDRNRHSRTYSLPPPGCRCLVPAPTIGKRFGVREGINKPPVPTRLQLGIDIELHEVLMFLNISCK